MPTATKTRGKASKGQATSEGPKRLEDFPAYVAAKERLEAVRARKADVDARLLKMMESGEQAELRSGHVDRQVQAVLEGRPIHEADLVKQESYQAITQESKAVERAIEVASAEYQNAWQAASAGVIASRLDEHKEIVGEIKEHLEALVSAVTREQAWIDDLRSSGLHFQGGLGGVVSPQSRETAGLFAALKRFKPRAYERRLAEHGYL